MERGLQNRHVQIIAIAGTIGTGLFWELDVRLIWQDRLLSSFICWQVSLCIWWWGRLEKCCTMIQTSIHLSISSQNILVMAGVIFLAGRIDLPLFLLVWQKSRQLRNMSNLVPNLACLVDSKLSSLYFEHGQSDCGTSVWRGWIWFAMVKIVAIIALIVTAIFMVLTGLKPKMV